MSRFVVKSCSKILRPWTTSPIPVYGEHLPSSRHFCVSQNLAGPRSAWEKKRVKGRKPAYLGRAPTKLEIVDPEPTLDDEEQKLLAEWQKQYEVDMTHCYDLIKEKAVLDSLDTGAEKRWILEERKHHANMMKANDEWNEEVAVGRELDLASSRDLQEEQVRSSVAALLAAKEIRQSEVMAYVDRLQEESPDYITFDNLDEKIDEALEAAIVSYDFALDRSGKMVKDKKNMAVLSSS